MFWFLGQLSLVFVFLQVIESHVPVLFSLLRLHHVQREVGRVMLHEVDRKLVQRIGLCSATQVETSPIKD